MIGLDMIWLIFERVSDGVLGAFWIAKGNWKYGFGDSC